MQKSVTSSADDFLTFCLANMPLNICSAAEQSTRSQSNNHAWFELRYGRITASKCFQASRCQTANGSLVNKVIGISKMFSTEAMSRGKNLEKIVANKLKSVQKINFSDCGIFLMPEYPVLGASPEGIGDDFIVEIKCPSTENGFNNFLPNNKIGKVAYAQMQLQMLTKRKGKGLFCVAHPDYEATKKITTKFVDYDEKYTIELIDCCSQFWKKNNK